MSTTIEHPIFIPVATPFSVIEHQLKQPYETTVTNNTLSVLSFCAENAHHFVHSFAHDWKRGV
jgi:hypothetical protein